MEVKQKEKEMSSYREQLEDWLKTLHIKADRVLDLGGAANPVQKRLGSIEHEEYICFDLGVEEPKREYIKFDINLPLKQLKGCEEKSFNYDCIFCLEVFEYVWNPVEAMKNIHKLLCSDGIAYISWPSIYPVHNPVEIDYLRFTRASINKYLDLFNFKLISITPRVAKEGGRALSEFYSKEGMHPVKQSVLPYDIGYMTKITKRQVVDTKK